MVEPSQAVVDEAVHEGETMSVRDLVERIERYHDGPGVDRDTVAAYARELESRRDYAFDAEAFLDDVAAHTTDAETWEGNNRLYALGKDRISLFPAQFHDQLGGSTDVPEYLRFFLDDAPAFLDDIGRSAAGGVPEDALIEVVEAVGRVDRGAATEALHEARDAGAVIEDTDQHPQGAVYLRDRAPEDLLD